MRALLCLFLLLLSAAPAAAADRFSYERIKSVPEMEQYIQDNLPLGTQRKEVERVFVLQGRATLKHHPEFTNVEKYLYDINLCDYYIFRWNISADYDEAGALTQMYINGNPVFAEGTKPPLPLSKPGAKAKITRETRDWPQASKGGKSLQYMMFDADGKDDTKSDRFIIGFGATNVDPANFGEGVRFNQVELWRSIYDDDVSNDIAAYSGSCAEADTKYLSRELFDDHHGYMP